MDDEIEHGLISALELGFAEDTGAIEVLYIIIIIIIIIVNHLALSSSVTSQGPTNPIAETLIATLPSPSKDAVSILMVS